MHNFSPQILKFYGGSPKTVAGIIKCCFTLQSGDTVRFANISLITNQTYSLQDILQDKNKFKITEEYGIIIYFDALYLSPITYPIDYYLKFSVPRQITNNRFFDMRNNLSFSSKEIIFQFSLFGNGEFFPVQIVKNQSK